MNEQQLEVAHAIHLCETLFNEHVLETEFISERAGLSDIANDVFGEMHNLYQAVGAMEQPDLGNTCLNKPHKMELEKVVEQHFEWQQETRKKVRDLEEIQDAHNPRIVKLECHVLDLLSEGEKLAKRIEWMDLEERLEKLEAAPTNLIDSKMFEQVTENLIGRLEKLEAWQKADAEQRAMVVKMLGG